MGDFGYGLKTSNPNEYNSLISMVSNNYFAKLSIDDVNKMQEQTLQHLEVLRETALMELEVSKKFGTINQLDYNDIKSSVNKESKTMAKGIHKRSVILREIVKLENSKKSSVVGKIQKPEEFK